MSAAELGGSLRFADVWLVIGTRPEAIKLSPLARALSAQGIAPTLIFSGQHPHLEAAEFGLDAYARIDLGCRGQEDPHAHVRAVTLALAPLLRNEPGLVVVQGDTSSALGAALAAFTAAIPVAHVEAGLRSHDLTLPWPEEEYRMAIDANAELLFAPTELAAANLRAEQAQGEVYVTGNTSIDAVLEVASRLPPRAACERGVPRILATCHRRESWRDGLSSIAAAITEIASIGAAQIDVILHPNPFVASTMRRLLSGARGVELIEPCGHKEMVARMREADLLLSDSGGIQEEAPALGVALLVMRDKTERPEGLAAGTARLVGTSKERIISEVLGLLGDPVALAAMTRPAFPFGDGHAAERIAAKIVRWLQQTALTHRLA